MSNIEKRGESSYRLTASSGYDTNGKQVRKTKTINLSNIPERKRAEEAYKQWILFKEEVEKGTYLDAARITFAEFIERWRENYAEIDLELKTQYGYNQMINNRIIPSLGHIKLAKLQPLHLLEFYRNLKEHGVRLDDKCKPRDGAYDTIKKLGLSVKDLVALTGVSDKVLDSIRHGRNISKESANKIAISIQIKFDSLFEIVSKPGGLSERSIKHYHEVIGSILEDAVKWQVLIDNPALRVDAPTVVRKRMNYYSEEQVLALFDALENEPINYKIMVMLALFTGLRIGELMGLEWSDFDLEKGLLEINKVSQYVSGEGTFTKEVPKNEFSIRVLSIPEYMVNLLKNYKIWQDLEKQKCGDLWKNSNRLFTTWDGAPQFTYTLTNWFPQFLARHNLSKITPHGLRHTCATLLALNGLSIPELSKFLGHARISTTSDIYVHELKKLNITPSTILQNTLIKNRK